MAKNQNITLANGSQITEGEYREIRRDATKTTVRNILAGVGVLALGVFAYGLVKPAHQPNELESSTDE